MRTVAIIQARMGSTRLPGKVLMDVGGRTVLQRVVDRVRHAEQIDEVVVATTQLPRDAVIEGHCGDMNVACFRGSESDVLDRYLQAAKQFQAEAVVRITSDCPLIDAYWIDKAVQALARQIVDCAYNDVPRTLPRGLDVEAFTFSALQRAADVSDQAFQREHVTAVFYDRRDWFRVVCLPGQHDWAKYRLTVDTPQDLELIRKIYASFGDRDDFGWREVLDLMQRSPDLADINAGVVQKPMQQALSLT